MKQLNYETKEKMVQLAGTCFWYWDSFYSFLDSCHVPSQYYTKYPKASYNKYSLMRSLLTELEQNGKLLMIQELISGFYKLNKPVDTDVKDPEKAKALLIEFKNHVGKDPIENEIQKRELENKQKEYIQVLSERQNKKIALANIYKDFCKIFFDINIAPQKKGFELEKFFFQVLSLEEFEFTPPYRTDTQQIDGCFKYMSFDYIVEIKFEDNLIKGSQLGELDRKINGKAQSTRGCFLSFNGYDHKHIQEFKHHEPRLVLIDGQEFTAILEGKRTFFDMFKTKVDQLTTKGEIFYKLNF